jgi:hypothetical protein
MDEYERSARAAAHVTLAAADDVEPAPSLFSVTMYQ